MVVKEKKGGIAPESSKTKRTREKLLKQWEEEKKRISPEALQETVDKIHKWIADNARHRIPIKEKSIKLFNQNKDAAAMSKKVQILADKIKNMEYFGAS